MMYKVTIIEPLAKVVTVEAEDEETAREKVENAYYNQKVTIGRNDWLGDREPDFIVDAIENPGSVKADIA